jgi:flagellar motor switch protein FliN/FliY
MSQSTKVSELLAAALHGAADVARTRLSREVAVGEVDAPTSNAILRFDLAFAQGGRLSWFISNEDATGFSDMLIGGSGDRAAVLTEMHLDALTVAFSDMLSRTVDGVAAGLDQPLEAGEIDLGMEGELPTATTGETLVMHGLDIAGFGPLAVVQLADAELSSFLDLHATATAPVAAAAAPAAAPVAEAGDAPASAGPAPVTQAGAAAHADNVVPLQAAAVAESLGNARPDADLDMLMNVPLPLTVELGQTQRTIRELVDFSIGSIIELGKLAGDPLDIKVNDRVIARGEVVVIDEEFGIRITEIVSPQERLQGLG